MIAQIIRRTKVTPNKFLQEGSTISSFEPLKNETLTWNYQQETGHCLNGKIYNKDHHLALFRRAIYYNDQIAWQTIYTQYQTLVTKWVWHHHRFYSTGEEAAFFVNAAFIRFWYSLSRRNRPPQIENLNGLLSYLKRCAHSAIEDAYRRQQFQDHLIWDTLPEYLADRKPTPEEQALNSTAQVLGQTIMGCLQNPEEKIIATLSWLHDLPPREIRALYPELFPAVTQIYRIKHNILKRLLRNPEIQKLRRELA